MNNRRRLLIAISSAVSIPRDVFAQAKKPPVVIGWLSAGRREADGAVVLAEFKKELATLGWQGSTEFLTVLSEHDYLIQDNHNRFLGGVWAAIGLMLIVAPLDLQRFRPVLNFIFALIFVGGLARFTAVRADVVFGPDIAVSLVAELVGMPLLFFWLARATRSSAA